MSNNVFRKEYRPLTDEEQASVNRVKETAQTLYAIIDSPSAAADPRSLAVAKTKLEEAVMWAVKGFTA